MPNVLKQFASMGMGGKPAWATNTMHKSAGVGGEDGQYGAKAMPQGNAWGQQFMQQYGSPPGQMHDQWAAFRQQNGIGGGPPAPIAQGAAPAGVAQPGSDWRQSMSGWIGQRPQRPSTAWENPMARREAYQGWMGQRPQFPGNELAGAFGGQHPWLQALLNRIR